MRVDPYECVHAAPEYVNDPAGRAHPFCIREVVLTLGRDLRPHFVVSRCGIRLDSFLTREAAVAAIADGRMGRRELEVRWIRLRITQAGITSDWSIDRRALNALNMPF